MIRIKGLRFSLPPQIGIILEGYWYYLSLKKEEQEAFTIAAQNPTLHWDKLVKLVEANSTLSYDGRLAFAEEKDHIRMYHIDDADQTETE